ncbi:DMT family transporter [Lawsonibacter asaccharolyticus]|uniref:DMT family transporter n=1 Tax=Eubacteriales TaxID=186802 RepID=UPI00067F6FC0|nr:MULTISPECIES: EamA family transporter [Eubacteriales]UMM47675.1 DMT family transporter [Lawsonibacter asaccharolyticus]
MSHKKAIAITCFVALMWSLAGFNIKMIEWSPYAIAAGRSLVAVILLAPMVLRKGFQKIDRYVIGGAICYAAFNYCFITSTTLTSSAIAIMMQYTAPIYVALLSWLFLRERVGWADIISVGFVFLGMIFFFLDSNSGGSLKGNIVSIFNGITFAGISIFLRLQKDGNPALSMYLGNVISAVAGLPIMWNAGMPDTISLLFLLLAGLLVAVSYTLYAKASTGLSALETVLIPIIDPVMNPVWVFLFLDERPGALTIVGAAVILVSVTIRVVSGLTPSSASRTRG